MKFEIVRNILGKVMYYRSDIKTEINETLRLSKYLILKKNNGYYAMQLKDSDYLSDWIKEESFIAEGEAINEYELLFFGNFKRLKDAKAFILDV